MITFNKIVNKLLKKWWKVILKSDIFEIIDPEKKPEYTIIVNKTIYRLKSENIIKPIRNGVYIIPDAEDLKLNEIDVIEKYYYALIKKYITYHLWSDYFISWKKSLEIHLKNYAIPEKIIIVNRTINKKIFIWNYCIIFKTLTKKTDNKDINLYSKLSKLTKVVSINDVNFKISNLELALIESALISDNIEGIDIEILSKTIKKYGKFFVTENFYTIWELKFIMAFNRLKEISKNIDKNLYLIFLDIIKKNWGLFIGEGLRKIF